MKTLIPLTLSLALSLPVLAGDWEELITPELDKWTVWTGVPHPTVDVEWPHKAIKPQDGKPMGEGDPLNLYQVKKAEDGSLQLYITGQVYAGLTTKKSYENYHLTMEVKWGEKKYEPRLERPRDSGILYHCQGPHGAFWKVWKKSLECQVQENDNGDYFRIAAVDCEIPSIRPGEKMRWRFDPKGEWRSGEGSVQRGENYEKAGEWNKVEVITVGDKAIHLSNGKLVLALRNARHKEGDTFVPLTSGQIQIQSEGAEVTYRNLRIKPIDAFPAEHKAVFPE